MRVAGAGVRTGIVIVRHDTTGLDLLADPSGSGWEAGGSGLQDSPLAADSAT